MNDLERLILQARDGDADAYATVVRRFQDMAVGFGLAALGDAGLAEDAAQEAFLEAFRCLGALREPAAFPGWFRCIVVKQCDRIARRRRINVPLDAASDVTSSTPLPDARLESDLRGESLRAAIDELPAHERTAVMLFHIGEHSHRELSEFLGVPVSTIKKRLHDGRARLRSVLLDRIERDIRGGRPSRDERFAVRVVEILGAARSGDAVRVRELLLHDARLATARDSLGNTALVIASKFGRDEIVTLLRDAGVVPDVHEASSIGATARVAALVDEDAKRVDGYSREGFTPLALAAHHDHPRTAEYLIDRGADVNAVARHALRVTPLHAALFGRSIRSALVLVERGADVNAARGGSGPRSGWTALHYAAGLGFEDVARELVARGAKRNAVDASGRTAVDVAIEAGNAEVARMLRHPRRRSR